MTTAEHLADIQQRINRERQHHEARLAQLEADRDALLRKAWHERIPQRELAGRIGLSPQRIAQLQHRARGAA